MPKITTKASIGVKAYLNACTDQELRQLARLIKKQPYRGGINEQLTLFKP